MWPFKDIFLPFNRFFFVSKILPAITVITSRRKFDRKQKFVKKKVEKIAPTQDLFVLKILKLRNKRLRDKKI